MWRNLSDYAYLLLLFIKKRYFELIIIHNYKYKFKILNNADTVNKKHSILYMGLLKLRQINFLDPLFNVIDSGSRLQGFGPYASRSDIIKNKFEIDIFLLII